MYKHYIDFCIILINSLSVLQEVSAIKSSHQQRAHQLHFNVGSVMQYDYCEQPRLTGTDNAAEQSWPETFQLSLAKTDNVIKKNNKTKQKTTKKHNFGSSLNFVSDCSTN